MKRAPNRDCEAKLLETSRGQPPNINYLGCDAHDQHSLPHCVRRGNCRKTVLPQNTNGLNSIIMSEQPVDIVVRQLVCRKTTNKTTKDVDVVFDDGPSAAVGRLAVKRVGHRLLRQTHRPIQIFLVNFPTHQL